jgi:hypothetical protein
MIQLHYDFGEFVPINESKANLVNKLYSFQGYVDAYLCICSCFFLIYSIWFTKQLIRSINGRNSSINNSDATNRARSNNVVTTIHIIAILATSSLGMYVLTFQSLNKRKNSESSNFIIQMVFNVCKGLLDLFVCCMVWF